MIYIPTGIQKGIYFNVCLLVYFSLARVTCSVTWPSRNIAVLLWFLLFFIFTAFCGNVAYSVGVFVCV